MATLTIEARFDGEALRPERPLGLVPDAVYTITIETPDEPRTIWNLLDRFRGTIDAPEDWSAEHDHYIHGTPKRRGRVEGC